MKIPSLFEREHGKTLKNYQLTTVLALDRHIKVWLANNNGMNDGLTFNW